VLGRSILEIEVFEDDVPPRFRVRAEAGALPASDLTIETTRPNGSRQLFIFEDRGDYLESRDEIPEPHAFVASIRLMQAGHSHERELEFEEHGDDDTHGHGHGGAHHRDNNMRAAIVHVMADAAVSVLVIVGLLLARAFGWLWMDPLAGFIGALVIANWSVGLLRDTGGILLDRTPDPRMAEKVRKLIEVEGDQVTDLHLWRLGPGHLGAIVCVCTAAGREAAHYRQRLARFADLSHVTVEVQHPHSFAG
jgi:cation diffusion facilitator family transporter